MGSNTEKKPWTNLQPSYKNLSKEIKSDNFFYCKVGRAITKLGAMEKSPILLSQILFCILMVEIIFSPTVCYWQTTLKKIILLAHLQQIAGFYKEKGIATIRIYQYWQFHHTGDCTLFWDAKILRTREIMTLFKL